MRELPAILDALDPQAALAQRHLWLISLLDWIRGDASSAPAAVHRVQQFLDAVQSQPAVQQRLQDWWLMLIQTVDATTLLADFGFAPRTSFISELGERLRHKLLPATPETTDSAELFSLLLRGDFDASWLSLLDEATLEQLVALLSRERMDGLTHWQYVLMEALTYCVSQLRAAGFSPELRLRMSEDTRIGQPFHTIAADFDALRLAFVHKPIEEDKLQALVETFKARLEACRQATTSVYSHLDEYGVSVGLVFRLRQLRERVLRIRELLDCLLASTSLRAATPAESTVRLLVRLIATQHNRSSIRALITSNTTLIAAKVAERSAETGEHYITRNHDEYRDMLRKAAGGGAFMSLTTLFKFMVLGLGLSAFWGGFFASLNYAASFVAIQLLHWTVATKQPAMTAPAMAAKLRDLDDSGAIETFVDEVAHLVRSQVAAVVGNLALVAPCVLLLSGAIWALSGHPMISPKEAEHVLHTLTLLGPTALFAAFTGVLLFASSIIAGWAENWFVLHRLDSALRYNPRITSALGPRRAARWADFMRQNISGFASNMSLGFMLGLIPAFAMFFGLDLEVRHVTLSTGQIAAAGAALGLDVLHLPAFWWCVAGLVVTGPLNVGVSFYLAFRLALRAHSVSAPDRGRIRRAIFARVLRHPLSFLWPPRGLKA
jgi:site-specific recombinase